MTVKNILVPTDFSAGSEQAVRYAFDLAVSLGATLHFLHVIENPFAPGAFMELYAPPPAEYFNDAESQADARLRHLLSPQEQSLVNVVISTRMGTPATVILERLAEEPKIDLVVMATHGRSGVARMVMGSVADKVVRMAPCPVLTLREHPRPAEAHRAA